MIRINRRNFNDLVKGLIKASQLCRYNSECYSTSDIKREREANGQLNHLYDLLEEKYLDLFTLVKPLCDEVGESWDDISYGPIYYKKYFKYIPEDLEVIFEGDVLEMYLDESLKIYIEEGNEAPVITNHYIQWRTSSSRFVYQKWNTDAESINQLINESQRMKNDYGLIRELYPSLKLKSFEMLRDVQGVSDCSEAIIIGLDEQDNEFIFLVSVGGFYKDLGIFKNKELLDVLPLNKEDKGCVRVKEETYCHTINPKTGIDEMAPSGNTIYTANLQRGLDYYKSFSERKY